MKISFAKPGVPESGTVVVMAGEGGKLCPAAETLDSRTEGALARAAKAARFKGARGSTVTLLAPAGTGLDRILLLGLGAPRDLNDLAWQDAGGHVCAALAVNGPSTVSVIVESPAGCKMAPAEAAAHFACGARLRGFRFDKYMTRQDDDGKPTLAALRILVEAPGEARTTFAPLDKVVDGVVLTRNLVSEPANVLYPESLAETARRLEDLGVKVKVLDEKDMRKLGMGALLGVAQGSAHPPRLVTMDWNGVSEGKSKKAKPGKGDGPVAFVGKGVTFDSGGISIKPAAGMEDMKWDMGGAAVVIGLMAALAGRKARVHAVGVIGLVENMPSGTAQRPGDVVTTMSGQTVEVINTDAEGRLVLADALRYCQDTFKPRAMIDLATLTGAIIIGLGEHTAGLFANNDKLAKALTQAGERVGEAVWRLPMGEDYDKQIKSDIADMKNVGGRSAGSITAAQFLKRFVGDLPWAHLDIAGVTWAKADKPTVPKGGTGFGVRLLDRLVADVYETK